MLREMTYYGSFDNYILLARPSKMVSMFGEYLRELMYRKINNPDLDVKNGKIFGTTKDVFKKTLNKKI